MSAIPADPPTSSSGTRRLQIETSIRESLRSQGSINELRIAGVRIAVYSAILLADLLLGAVGRRPFGFAFTSVGLVAVSIVLFLAIRRFYRPAYRYAIPAVDLVLIASLLEVRFAAIGLTMGTAAAASTTYALVVTTSSLRFARRIVAWTTLLAFGGLFFSLWRRFHHPDEIIYSGIALLGTGMINLWLVDQVRRAMEGGRSRDILKRFLPGTLVDATFRDPMAAVAEPKRLDATVLVTDVRGFTTYAETVSPEEVVAFLDVLHGALADAVESQGGTVDKFLGDGMLAVFGAPRPQVDHAARALRAVDAIRSAVTRLNAGREIPVRIGIGVHSGPLVAGTIGSGSRMEFTIVGDTVNVAARLESMTKEMGVETLVSAETLRRAGRDLAEAHGEVQVRGRAAPLRVHAL